MKINDLLNIKSNYSNDEKKIILSFLLDLPKLDLFKLEEITDKKVINKYKKMLNNNLPLAYLLNEAYLFGNKFYVNKNVLIPRPETEVLVEEVYNLINKYFNDKVKICDLGTGSGVIGITLKKLNNSFDVTCIDISKKALKVAKKNSIYLNTDINFINSDMLKRVNDNFDVIYIDADNSILLTGTSLSNKTDFLDKIINENKSNYKINIMHYPDDFNNIKKYNYDLVLAGHSHNGQVNLPIYGPIIKFEHAKKYYKPYYKVDNTDLYISSGIGTTDFDFRFLNKPSFNFYRLTKK
mgnify:CR=1 FL=1